MASSLRVRLGGRGNLNNKNSSKKYISRGADTNTPPRWTSLTRREIKKAKLR
jgi:hypothetical protein